ncbi:MAG: dihydrodipicolinate synthase family protein, partial [Candidatus Hydrogenedentales bacterium]
MTNSPHLRGIITVLNTPFTRQDTIDIAGLRANVRNAMDAGVAGLCVPALASEVGSLSDGERDAIVAAVIEEVGGRMPVIGGAHAPTQPDRLRNTRRLFEQGCAGVLVNIPFTDAAAFERDFAQLAAGADGFLMLQDWDPVGPGLSLDLIVRLAERVPAFTWLKIEVVPAGPKYTQVIEATNGRLNLAGGWAVMQLIEALDRGIHAFMPTAMHRIYTRIYALYAAGDRPAAQDLFNDILPVLAF